MYTAKLGHRWITNYNNIANSAIIPMWNLHDIPENEAKRIAWLRNN